MSLDWSWQRFENLGVDGVYDMLALRAKVFVLEQGPYLDPDGADRRAWHLLGRKTSGELLAYLRVLDPGVKFDEVSIGRVAGVPATR
jgi:ElaA protein